MNTTSPYNKFVTFCSVSKVLRGISGSLPYLLNHRRHAVLTILIDLPAAVRDQQAVGQPCMSTFEPGQAGPRDRSLVDSSRG
jgi:hypothetical protein